VKFFFTEIRFQNQKCADIDVEIAMSVLLLLRMIFVSHQQKPSIHTHNEIYNSFNSYEEEEEKSNFPIGVLELCFLFAVSKEKKRIILHFIDFLKIFPAYTLELQKNHEEEKTKLWIKNMGGLKLKLCVVYVVSLSR